MSKQIIMIAFAAALGVLVTVLVMDSPKAMANPGDAGARYDVVGSQNGFVLVDLSTSQSWVLLPQPNDKGRYAWFPVERLDTPAKVQLWRAGGSGKDDTPK